MINLNKFPYYTYGDKVRIWKRINGEDLIIFTHKPPIEEEVVNTINYFTRRNITMRPELWTAIKNIICNKEKSMIIGICGDSVDLEEGVEKYPNCHTDYIMLVNTGKKIKILWKPQPY